MYEKYKLELRSLPFIANLLSTATISSDGLYDWSLPVRGSPRFNTLANADHLLIVLHSEADVVPAECFGQPRQHDSVSEQRRA